MNNFSLNGLQGFDMYGKTAGVIGTGQIGALVVRLLSAFGMKVYAHDMYENEQLAQETGCVYTDIDTLYRNSDIISLHCPLTPETRHIINGDSIKKMKDGAIIINTGRGQLIETVALIEALKEQKVAGAALDVYEEEERFFFEDHSAGFIDDDVLARLMTFPNVIITSHQAFFTTEALEQIASTTLSNIQCFFENRPLENEVVG